MSTALRRRLFMGVAWLVLVQVRFLLRRFGYRRVHRWMARWSPATDERTGFPRCRVNARLIDRVALGWMKPPATCLHRSLALWWLLRFQRIPARIRTGARRKDAGAGEWELHAWVEHHGRIINDDPAKIATYRVIPDRLGADAEPEEQPR